MRKQEEPTILTFVATRQEGPSGFFDVSALLADGSLKVVTQYEHIGEALARKHADRLNKERGLGEYPVAVALIIDPATKKIVSEFHYGKDAYNKAQLAITATKNDFPTCMKFAWGNQEAMLWEGVRVVRELGDDRTDEELIKTLREAH